MAADPSIEDQDESLGSPKPKSRKKKEKKRKRSQDLSDDDAEVKEDVSSVPAEIKKSKTKENIQDTESVGVDKDAQKLARKAERRNRKKEKEALLEQVPKVDKDGIAYTKLQRKRMMKRVKQGLPPVPTEAEEQERRRNEAQLRREEEAELAGMIFNREDYGQSDTEEPKEDEEDNDDAEDEEDVEAASPKLDERTTESPSQKLPPKKKSKRSKAVPSDYICQACKNQHQPAHWIYDCPDKVTVKGTNKKKKKDRGFHEPDSRKVFVSGLPFDVKQSDIQQLFQRCGKVTCRLVKFGDTGRCNGQAYVTFETDEAATKALKLSGTTIDNSKDDGAKKKSKKSDSSKRKELKLKISKVLNRRFTKNVKT